MTDAQIGTTRTRSRTLHRRVIAGGMMAAGLGYGLVVPRLHGQDGAVAALTVCFLVAVAIGGLMSWRQRDEVERREATIAFGASGFSLLFLFPALRLSHAVVPLQDPMLVLWLACIAIGLAVWTIRRFRS